MRHNFEQLVAWKKSRAFVKRIYVATQSFPSEEKFGLTSQIRRAAVSIPSNIAEGCGFESDKQVIRFLEVAVGSSCELETQLFLAFDLEYLDQSIFDSLREDLVHLRKTIIGFQHALKSNLKNTQD